MGELWKKPVGAGLPAMDVNDNEYRLDKRGALTSIASKLAPTVECIDLLNHLLTLDRQL
jgi:hypothetical protein